VLRRTPFLHFSVDPALDDMRGLACSAAFMRQFEASARNSGWTPGQNGRGLKKHTVQALKHRYCFTKQQVYDLLKAVELQAVASRHMPTNEAVHPSILIRASRAGKEHAPKLIENAVQKGWTAPKGQRRWSAICPAHNDHTPSLTITEGKRRTFFKCWVGCDEAAIIAGAGLKLEDVWYEPAKKTKPTNTTRPSLLTVEALAAAKQLPASFLRVLGLRDVARGVEIPYFHLDGTPGRSRLRKTLTRGWRPGGSR
jgi:hypothetical protein